MGIDQKVWKRQYPQEKSKVGGKIQQSRSTVEYSESIFGVGETTES